MSKFLLLADPHAGVRLDATIFLDTFRDFFLKFIPSVVESEGIDEIYILGNPPYLGGKGQSAAQKEDLELVFKGNKNFKELDYIACWFFIASDYIDTKSKFAFVTTSSLCEGAQVEQIWPLISKMDNEIFFAYEPVAQTQKLPFDRLRANGSCVEIIELFAVHGELVEA